MKQLLRLFLSFFIFPAFAVTSESYVDAAINTLQNEIPAENANTVLTNTGSAGEIGTKRIYDSHKNFSSQQNALVTAETFNSAVQNAIDNEFVCIEASAEGCLLYKTQINTLPAGYTRLEYLESTGTQYIDTNVPPTSNVGVSVRYAFTQLEAQRYIFGSYDPHFYLGINSIGAKMVMAYGAGSGNVVLSVPVANISTNTIYAANMNMYNSHMVEFVGLNGPIQMAEKSFSDNNRRIYLFAMHNGGQNYLSGAARIYSMQITDGITMVRNFIPARRNSDGELGMYDTITNAFFTNAGTGNFIAGPEQSQTQHLQ